MKKLIILSLISILFSCGTSHARNLLAIKEREMLQEINKYKKKLSKLECHKFEELPQKQLNKCFVYGISLLQTELEYSDFIEEMVAENLNMGTGVYAKKKPRNFYGE